MVGMVKKTKLRNWTAPQRQQQSARIRAEKIWLKSTGPKTDSGKKRSSRNAVKHGMRSARVAAFKKLLRLQNQLLEKLKKRERIERAKRRYVIAMLKMGYTAKTFKKFHERTGRLAGLEDKMEMETHAYPQKSCHPGESGYKR